MRKVTSALLIAVVLIASAIAEQFPVSIENTITTASRVMNYQGILKNSAGDPVDDGDYNLTFRIYDAAEGGSLLWMEAATIATSDGFFTRQLGLSSPLNLPFNADYYLSIQVQGDVAMAERQRFTLSPYSARCDTAETATNSDLLDGQHADSFASSGHNHDAAYVNEGQSNSINSSMISDGTVATTDIQNSTILFNDIAQNGATSNQVMKWNGSAWVARNDSLGSGSNWNLLGNVLYTNGTWGISRGGAANILYGTLANSHTNLGSACTTGTSGNNHPYATICGGYTNRARGPYSTIGGGMNNIALDYATVSGGNANLASGNTSYIGGGYADTVSAWFAVVSGGIHNVASGNSSTIAGGDGNAASGVASAIGGGFGNRSTNTSTTVGGGYENSSMGNCATVGGGYRNNVAIGADQSIVGGGDCDTVKAVYGGVSAGFSNLAGDATTDTGAYVGGGIENSATANLCFIGGGYNNKAGENYATVGGGGSNNSNGNCSFVGGGQRNTASGSNATISGGYGNICLGESSSIPGGYCDTIASTGYKSMVFGANVYNSDSYRVVFFDGSFFGSLNINRDGRDGTVNSYPIQIGTSASNGNGAYLTSGGVWTNGSSRTFKENFTPYNGAELLSKISNLSLTSYNYINSTEKHFGPVAEEFVDAFDTGVIREDDGLRDDKYLAASDVAGVALAGVQELIEQNKTLLEKIDILEKRISELENR